MPDPSLPADEQIRRTWPLVLAEETISSRRGFLEEMLGIDVETPTPLETIVQQMSAIRSFDSYDRLPSIGNRTLVVHGDSDALIPAENACILHERIPGSQLEIMPGAGHMFFWDAPEKTASILKSFLLAPAGER